MQTQTRPNSRSSDAMLALFAECDEHSSGIAPPPALALSTIALLNPPFGKKDIQHEVAETYELGHGWRRLKEEEQSETTDKCKWRRTGRVKKSTKLEALFLELAIRSLEPSEVMVALVPNSILADNSSHVDRAWLLTQAQLWASVQLPKEVWQAECKTGITTSVVVFQKLQEPTTEDYSIFMAVLENCGFDSRGKTIPGSELEQVSQEFESFLSGESTP